MRVDDHSLDVSVLICSRNRADNLRAALRCVMQSAAPRDFAVELVIVDNGSEDNTAEVIASFSGASQRYPVCHLYEPIPGKSIAQNRGLRHCRGTVLLLMDDDVRPGATWLAAMSRPILLGQADISYGPVALAPDLRRAWMTDFHQSCLACFERGPPHVRRAVSANLAIRRDQVSRLGGFDVNLGPGRLGFGDETLLIERLLAETQARGLPVGEEGLVVHYPDPQRLMRSAWVLHAQNMGRSFAYIHHHYFLRHPRYVLAREINARLRLMLFRWSSQAAGWQNEGIAPGEYELIRRVAYWKLMRSLAGSRPNYHSPSVSLVR